MKFFDWVESAFYILPSLATFLTAWFVHKHTFPKFFTHQQHIFTFIPLHRSERKIERDVKSKLPQCKSNFCVRKACKTEEKKYKIYTNKFYIIRRSRKVNVYFLLQTKTKQIGMEKYLLLLDVCTFHVFISKKVLLVDDALKSTQKVMFWSGERNLTFWENEDSVSPQPFSGFPIEK